MSLKIELPAEVESALTAQAAARGLTIEEFVRQLALQSLGLGKDELPYFTGFGMLADLGKAPSFEDIKAVRREMFSKYADDI